MTPAGTDPRDPEQTRPNLGWVLGIAIVGAALLLLPLVTAESAAVPGIWQSIAVNFGSAAVFAAILVYIEPRFRKRYVDDTTRTVEAVTEKVEAKFETRVEELTESIESARALFQDYMAADDDAVAAMGDGHDFYSVATALVAANRAHAIDPVLGVAIPASQGIPDVVLRFRYVSPNRFSRSNGSSDRLQVTPLIVGGSPEGTPRITMDMDWPRNATSDEFGASLMVELQRNDVRDVTSKLTWSATLGRLQETLALAIDSKRSTGKLIGSHLIEKGPGEWVLTSLGIEYIGRGVLAGVDKFPSDLIQAVSPSTPWKDVVPPDWADPDEWNFMMERAREVLPKFNTPYLLQRQQYASTREPRRPMPRKPAPPVTGGH